MIALMIYLGEKNLSGLSRAIPDARNQCSLYRFLSSQDGDTEQVKHIRLELLNRKARRALEAMQRKGQAWVYLIIDDSLVEKTGKRMEGVAKHRSHKEKKQLCLGHVWVTTQLVIAGYSYPLDWAVYRRQDALDASTAVDAYFTLGDLQREHQRLAQRSTIALVFALTQQGLALEDIYERLAA